MLIAIEGNLQSKIDIFLDRYFAEHNLSKIDDNVRYLEHNFIIDADEEKRKLLSGEMRAVFKVNAWLDAQALTPLGEGGILVLADQYGQAFAVIKIRDIDIIKYGDMNAEFTQAFMIGDGSLQNWKDCCAEFLNKECNQLKVDFDDNTEILVTWIELLYPSD